MAQYFSPRVVTDGLISFLDAANRRSYPGSGTSWLDLTGNGNDGTIASGEFLDSGNGSYIRNLGNTSNFMYVTVGHSTSINSALTVTSGGWTIEELIWSNSVNYPEADAGGVASGPAYTTGATGFDWCHGSPNTSMRFGMSSNAASASSYEDDITINISSPYNSLNAWRLRSMIWDRSNNQVRVHVNGALAGSGSTPNTAGTAIYDGGGITFGSLYGWKHFGRRAMIRIYNRILTGDEILQNYVAATSRYNF